MNAKVEVATDIRDEAKAKAKDDAKQKAIAALTKRMGEPFPAELTENAYRVRRNLLVFSMIGLAIMVWKIPVEEYSGFKINTLPPATVHEILMCILGYHLVHFSWYAWDSFREWRLRLTGSKEKYITGKQMGATGMDLADDPRQATLYYWWQREAQFIPKILEPLEELKAKVQVWEKELRPFNTATNVESHQHISNAMTNLHQTQRALEDVKSHVETAQKVITAERIPASLKRFDEAFKHAQTWANARWLLIEILFPIVLGISALYLLSGISISWPSCLCNF